MASLYSTKNRPVAGVEKSRVSYKLASEDGLLSHTVAVGADFQRSKGMLAVAWAIKAGAKLTEACPLAEVEGIQSARHSVQLSGAAAEHVAEHLLLLAAPAPAPQQNTAPAPAAPSTNGNGHKQPARV